MKKKVAVGMSGGVDSSVAAYLLMEQGYDVVGVTMDFWHDDDDPADIYKNLIDASEAKAVCDCLGIEHYAINFTKEFRHDVEDVFAREYRHGRTPNPCIICNRHVKWGALLKWADLNDVEYVATGHYARLEIMPNGRIAVCRSASDAKDQTYVLYMLTQEQLKRTLFPIGEYEKTEIRKIAAKLDLPVAKKADSQDICFIDDGDYAKYLENKWNDEAKDDASITIPPEGDFVSAEGKVLGRHKGIHHYTIGQRKGLGISGEHPYFVCRIDTQNDTVTLGSDKDVWSDRLIADNVCYVGEENFDEDREYSARIRYSHKGAPCHIKTLDEGRIEVSFNEPVRAVTPGQAVVIYDKNVVMGGATII